jgi:hypothetical protein
VLGLRVWHGNVHVRSQACSLLLLRYIKNSFGDSEEMFILWKWAVLPTFRRNMLPPYLEQKNVQTEMSFDTVPFCISKQEETFEPRLNSCGVATC